MDTTVLKKMDPAQASVMRCGPDSLTDPGCPGSETGYYYERFDTDAQAWDGVKAHIDRGHTVLAEPVTDSINVGRAPALIVTRCIGCPSIVTAEHPEFGTIQGVWRSEALPPDEAEAALAEHLRIVHGVDG